MLWFSSEASKTDLSVSGNELMFAATHGDEAVAMYADMCALMRDPLYEQITPQSSQLRTARCLERVRGIVALRDRIFATLAEQEHVAEGERMEEG